MMRPWLRDLLPRLGLVALVGWVLYLREPAFHPHDEVEELSPELLSPLGLSAPMSYLAALACVILLAGFVSDDRRLGYYRITLSHPVHPLRWYGARWVAAVIMAFAAAGFFLPLAQLAGWGEFRGGWRALALAGASAWVWGGVMAFLGVALTRRDAWGALALFVPTLIPQVLIPLQGAGPALQALVLLLLPPQTTAFQTLYVALLGTGEIAWGALLFAFGYGTFWLIAAALLLRLREWP